MGGENRIRLQGARERIREEDSSKRSKRDTGGEGEDEAKTKKEEKRKGVENMDRESKN